MTIYITGVDALRVYRMSRQGEGAFMLGTTPNHDYRNVGSIGAGQARKLLLRLAHARVIPSSASNLEVRAWKDSRRPCSRQLKSHVTSIELPSQSFVELWLYEAGHGGHAGTWERQPSAFVDCPELCLLANSGAPLPHQSHATRKDLLNAIGLISECAGTYAPAPYPELGTTAYGTYPITTHAELASYLSQLPPIRGKTLLLQAMRWSHDGHDFPMETLMDCLLGLPPRLGGLGLIDSYVTNQPLELSQRKLQLIEHRCITPDFYFPRVRVALEYDGTVHTSERAMLEDHQRMQDYLALGIMPLHITFDNIRTIERLNRLFERFYRVAVGQGASDGYRRRLRHVMHSSSIQAERETLLRLLLQPIFQHSNLATRASWSHLE